MTDHATDAVKVRVGRKQKQNAPMRRPAHLMERSGPDMQEKVARKPLPRSSSFLNFMLNLFHHEVKSRRVADGCAAVDADDCWGTTACGADEDEDECPLAIFGPARTARCGPDEGAGRKGRRRAVDNQELPATGLDINTSWSRSDGRVVDVWARNRVSSVTD